MDFNARTIAIHGRQPALGRAELESLVGAEKLLPFSSIASLLSLEADSLDFARLGGTMRLARILTPLPSTEWKDIESYLLSTTPEHAAYIDGKLSFGLSVYGFKHVTPRMIARTALSIKKAIRANGHSVRMVPHDKTELSSATVLYNKLTSPNGWELIIVTDGKTAYLAQTTHIQDIDAYAARDQNRPFRDAKVGMLPPKLAQIIINLAVGRIKIQESRIVNESAKYSEASKSAREQSKIGTEASSAASGTDSTAREQRMQQTDLRRSGSASSQAVPESGATDRVLLLDPFCGTGVVLQEAMLMDYDIYGTDLEPRMIQYTIDNLAWLDTKYPSLGDYRRLEVGDATTHTWDVSKVSSRLYVAGETYLGKPLSSLPPGDQLAKIMHEVNALHHRFLQNISTQVPSGTRFCLAVPTWRGKHEFLHLSVLDFLSDLGYNRVKFEHVSNEDLIYHREGQVVGRELLVLIKK